MSIIQIVIPYTLNGVDIFYKVCDTLRESDCFIKWVLDQDGDILNDQRRTK
jgi:hypothetical protein